MKNRGLVGTIEGLMKKQVSREDILNFLRAHREEMVQKYHARVVGIFGSRARGDERADSDLDLLVEFLPGAGLIAVVGLKQFLEEAIECRVRVCSTRVVRPELRPSLEKELLTL